MVPSFWTRRCAKKEPSPYLNSGDGVLLSRHDMDGTVFCYLCYSMAIYRGFGLELKILFIYQSGRCLECRKAQE